MERTAGHAGRQAALAGLLSAIALACATVQDPPGGPPDPNPPVLLAVVPDSGVTVAGFSDEVSFEFDEVIQERGLEQLFTISPRHEQVDVSWHRRTIGVRPEDGWRDSVIYRVSMLPGVTDLRTNRSDSTYTLTFSTGGPIPQTAITGNAVDWENGRIAPRSLIEAIRPTDSLTYYVVADSTGRFSLDAVPPGRYLLVGTVDQNNNQRRERRESFDTLTIDLDSTLAVDFWMFVHDTVGPRIQTVTYLDSLAVGIDYSQSLALDLPDANIARVLLLPDSQPVPVDRYYWRDMFDSLRTAQHDSLAALADTLAPDSAAVADSIPGVAGDSVPGQPAEPIPGPQAGPDTPDPNAPDPAEVARIDSLLAQRDQPWSTLVLTLGEPLQPGARYVIETTVGNLQGAFVTSLRVLVTPVPPDSS